MVRVQENIDNWRRTHGWPPHSDPSWFRTWFDPTTVDSTPLPAVKLVGVLVAETDAERALAACGTLVSHAPCATVLPYGAAEESLPLSELDYYGVGVVIGDNQHNARLVIPPEDRSVEFGPSLYGRWLLEVLYDRIMRDQHAVTAPCPNTI